MSVFPNTLVDCPDAQAELDAYFETCTKKGVFYEPTPAYDFLMSPLNRQGVSQLQDAINPGPGKLRNVQLRYDQRILESEVDEVNSCDFTCTSSDKRGDGMTVYQLDPCAKLQISEAFNANDWMAACRSNPDIVMGKILRMMDVLVRRTATKSTDEMAAAFGTWSTNVAASGLTVNGSDQIVLNTLKAGTTDFNPGAMADLNAAFKYSNYCQSPVVFGGGVWDRYIRAMQVGCCANDGMDLAATLRTYGMASMWDMRIQDVLAANQFLTVMPGALQIVFWNSYAGQNSIDEAAGVRVGKNYDSGVLFHPRTGTPVNILLSDNCGELSVVMHTVSKVFPMPSDMFASGDTMEGVNFVNKGLITNA